MIIFLYGKDTFRSRLQLKKMIEKFKKDRDPSGYNTVRIDVMSAKDSTMVLENILAIPFLAEKRMVVVENLLTSKQVKLQEEILERLTKKSLPESTVVVFWEGTDSFKTKEVKKLFGLLREEKFAQIFDELIGVALQNWLKTEVAARGGEANMNTLTYLANNVGPDTWRLNFLLDQLVSFDEKITLGNVKIFLSEKESDNIFELVESVVRGDLKKVYSMLREQYDKGEDVQFVFAMLLRQARILLELRDLFDRESKLTSDLAAKKLGLHPFVAKKSWVLMKGANLGHYKNIYQNLLDLDVAIKTGSIDGELLLDIYLAKIADR